jgi:ribonuclease E
MGEKLLINVAHEETRVALVESGRLSNFEIVTSRADNNKGNIYKGIVHRVNASLQAAFVDYGADKQGFLPLGEIIPELYPKGQANKKLPIQDVLHQGQEIMVQVVKDEIGQKGAGLTTAISVAGRSLAIEANSDKAGISRRVSDEDRKRLKKEMNQLEVADGHGIIMRTAAADQDSGTIKDNKKYVEQLMAKAHERFRQQKGPGLVHQERSLPLRSIRDYVSSTVEEILIDDRETYEEVRNFCIVVAPEFVARTKFYEDPRPLFSRFQIEDQIDDIFARRIDLPSGGSIVIDQTEALVAIDVNSGRVKTDDIEDTATKTNLEAAAEIARQLKIRDRGGLIVVDFIDMRERDNIRRVEDQVRDAFKADKAKVKFTKISELGLMEISRQRLQGSVMRGSFTACPSCGGTGQIRSVESSALYLLRRMKETLLRGNHQHLEARMPVEIANYLLNRKRRELLDLERQTGTSIDVRAEGSCPPMQSYFELISRATQQLRRPKRVLQTIDLVRSEVERRDLEDGEEVKVEAAISEEADVSVFAAARAELDAQNKTLEADMARAKEIERAQKEADESLRREAELKAQKELLLAEAEKIRALDETRWKGMSIWGRLKAWFGGGLPPLKLDDEGHEERGERGERDRDERRRRRDDRDPKRRRERDGDDAVSAEKSGDKGDKPERSERSDRHDKRDRRDRDGKKGDKPREDKVDKVADKAEKLAIEKKERAERAERAAVDRPERAERAAQPAERPERDSELMEGGGAISASESDAKKKRRRRRRGKGGDEGEVVAGANGAERTERPERAERPERPERQPGQPGQQAGERPPREERPDRGPREQRDRRDRPQGERSRDRAGDEDLGEFVKATIVSLPTVPVISNYVPPAIPTGVEGEVQVAAPAPTPKLPKFGAIDLRGGTPKVIGPRPTPQSTEAPKLPEVAKGPEVVAKVEAPELPLVKAEAPKVEAPKVEAPKVEEVKAEEVKADDDATKVIAAVVDEQAEAAKAEKAEKAEAAKIERAEKAEAAKAERAEKVEAAKAEKAEKVEAAKAEKAEKVEAAKAETKPDRPVLPAPARAPKKIEPKPEPKVEAPKVEAPKVEAPKVDEAGDEAEGDEVEGDEVDSDDPDKKRRRGRGRRGGRGRTRRDGDVAAEGEAPAEPPKE